MKKNILIIGCGYWGTIVINCIKNLKKFKEIYICDEDPEKIKIIKKRFGNFVKNIKLKDISNNKDIKFIYLATPPSKNIKLIRKILPLNRNILLEKPGFSKLNEFKIVKKELKKTKSRLRFVVGYYARIGIPTPQSGYTAFVDEGGTGSLFKPNSIEEFTEKFFRPIVDDDKLINLLFPVIERTDEFCNFLDNFFAKYIATEIY